MARGHLSSIKVHAEEVAAAENHGRLLLSEGGQSRLREALSLALRIDLLPHHLR